MSLLAPFRPKFRPPSSMIASPLMPLVYQDPRPRFGGKEHVRASRIQRGDDNGSISRDTRQENSTDRGFEHLFISALVAAASCPRHRRHGNSSDSIAQTKKKSLKCRSLHRSQQRWLSSQSHGRSEPELQQPSDHSRDEYKELVNTYPTFDDGTEPSRPARRKREHYALAPRLVVTPFQELNLIRGARQIVPPEDAQHKTELEELKAFVFRPLGTISHDKMWELYQRLRVPRPRYIADAVFSRLFRQLQWTQFKQSEVTMQRYFTLLDECIAENVKVSRAVWNGAIDLAGRWLRRTSHNEIQTAVQTWMRMEQAGHRADHVTFNILFNIAVRTGRYALADTISAELKARELRIDRYFRSSLIYYAGLRKDGDAVRQAFRDLVDGGDIVDTTVMNAVIFSLIRAGEPAAAENVFQRMKSLHEAKEGTVALRDWRSKKELAQVLDRTGRLLQKEKKVHESSFFGAMFSADGRREQVQRVTPIAPDATTYALLIKYHSQTSGDLDRIRELLQEMAQHRHHIHGSIYTHILRGFQIHGGYAFSGWSRASLEEFWVEIMDTFHVRVSNLENDFSVEDTDAKEGNDRSGMLGAMVHKFRATDAERKHAALNEEESDTAPISELERPTYIARGLALAAVKAFYKCTGSKRMLEVWKEILERWEDGSLEHIESVQRAVDDMVEHDSIYIKDE